jgi:hypothetical protein
VLGMLNLLATTVPLQVHDSNTLLLVDGVTQPILYILLFLWRKAVP